VPYPGSYEIIATLGPSTETPDSWAALRAAGATRFRLNTSHLSVDELERWLARLGTFFSSTSSMPVVLDLQGSKWRVGEVTARRLETGELLRLAVEPGQGVDLPVPHPDFFRAAAHSDGRVLLNDARVHLEITDLDETGGRARARVSRPGPVSRAKGITLPASDFRRESPAEKDRRILERIAGAGGIEIALSYVRDGAELAAYRRAIGPEARTIAKVERPTAVADMDTIAQNADELWLCRGDLGAEVGLIAMAEAVSGVGGQIPALGVPVIMAGQVLEHMTAAPEPTRAEVVQLYDLLRTGYAGVVLSDETAVGSYPVEACRTAALFGG